MGEPKAVEQKTVSENNGEFQKILKELGIDNKELSKNDLTNVYGYMQETYCIDYLE